jgi:hypothetical protein
MSQSNAAAIRRRTNIQTQGPVPNAPNNMPQPPQQSPTSLTLPQIIALVDRRLVSLETFMKETKGSNDKKENIVITPNVVSPTNNNTQFVTEIELNTVIDEFNNRFEILATEINEMKDILLKLQSYTMDVNKMLLNERIQIFSDISLDEKSLENTLENTISVFNQDQNTSVDLRDLAIKELNEPEVSSTA